MPAGRVIDLSTLQQFTAVNLLLDGGDIGGPKVIPNAAEIKIKWGLPSGKFGYNVLCGRYTGTFAGTVAQANSILTGLTTGAQWTALAAFLSNGGGISAITIKDINTPGNPEIQSTGPAGSGTSVSAALPAEVAAVITLRTAFTGPANRGRMYVPEFATNAIGTGDIIAATAVTALNNWASIIAGVLNAQGYLWSVAHPARQQYTGTTGTVHPARVAGTVPVVTAVVRDNHWDTQRRRGLR